MATNKRMTKTQVYDLNYDVSHTTATGADVMLLRRAYWRLYAEVEACREELEERRCPLCRLAMCDRCAAAHECSRADIEKLETVEPRAEAPPPA